MLPCAQLLLLLLLLELRKARLGQQRPEASGYVVASNPLLRRKTLARPSLTPAKGLPVVRAFHLSARTSSSLSLRGHAVAKGPMGSGPIKGAPVRAAFDRPS